jgi:hypothetical protein
MRVFRVADGAPERCCFGIAPGGGERACDACEAIGVESPGLAFVGILGERGAIQVDRARVIAAVEGEVGQAV